MEQFGGQRSGVSYLPYHACASPCTSIARPKSASFTAAPFALLARSRFSGCNREKGRVRRRRDPRSRLSLLHARADRRDPLERVVERPIGLEIPRSRRKRRLLSTDFSPRRIPRLRKCRLAGEYRRLSSRFTGGVPVEAAENGSGGTRTGNASREDRPARSLALFRRPLRTNALDKLFLLPPSPLSALPSLSLRTFRSRCTTPLWWQW